jgi:hypothetical protein
MLRRHGGEGAETCDFAVQALLGRLRLLHDLQRKA